MKVAPPTVSSAVFVPDPHALADYLLAGYDIARTESGAAFALVPVLHPDEADPVGMQQIADRLGVKQNTVDRWRRRSTGFPEPRWPRVCNGPAWHWPDVRAWAVASGRLEPDGVS